MENLSLMKNILIVDDNKDMVDIVQCILRPYGFNVTSYNTSLNLMDVVKERKPNLILLDYRVLGASVRRICRTLKQLLSVIIIIFTTESNRKKSLRICDADDYLEKPFEVQELIEIVCLHLNSSKIF
jgi:DNA-binding response OmpR family regulator